MEIDWDSLLCKFFCDGGSSFLTNWGLLYSNETRVLLKTFYWLINVVNRNIQYSLRVERFKLQKGKMVSVLKGGLCLGALHFIIVSVRKSFSSCSF